jgi:hypothetical protein
MDPGHWALSWTLATETQPTAWTLATGPWYLDPGALNPRLLHGPWPLNPGSWTLATESWYLDPGH